jgi:hypothetical protein
LQKSVPFPVYVDGVYCPDSTTWRIVYSVYYPKDMTHRHDWERVVVVFSKGSTGDWWERKAIILAQHDKFNTLPWSSVTAHDDAYSGSPDRGANGAHPRVFVGMYKHAVSCLPVLKVYMLIMLHSHTTRQRLLVLEPVASPVIKSTAVTTGSTLQSSVT